MQDAGVGAASSAACSNKCVEVMGAYVRQITPAQLYAPSQRQRATLRLFFLQGKPFSPSWRPKNSALPPGSVRVSGRASALLGVPGSAWRSTGCLSRGSPTYFLDPKPPPFKGGAEYLRQLQAVDAA